MLKGRYQLLKGYENNHVTIGFGSYGQVKLARNMETSEVVAIKIINKLAKNQIVFHDRLSHPKIIKLLNHQIDKQRQVTYMVLEYADDGTLFEKIKRSPINKSLIKSYFRDVCEAIAYLHEKEIMHRDIKPQNVLLTKKNEQAKLCDFGFAAILGQRKTLCGTYEYMSPQMIQNKPYDFKIDIWALGILLFEMISGQAPFRGESPEQVLQQMKTKIFFCERFDLDQINLIKKILRVTPQKRPTVFQILEDPYFRYDNKSSESSSDGTKQSQVNRKLTNVSSNRKIEEDKSDSKQSSTKHKFQKKFQEVDLDKKQPQNSFPFYVPKAKYNVNGGYSSGSNGNSINGSPKLQAPQFITVKYQNKSNVESLAKKQPIKSKVTSHTSKKAGQAIDNKSKYVPPEQSTPKFQYQGIINTSTTASEPTTNTTSKVLNNSMGSNVKSKFTEMYGQHINLISVQKNQQKPIYSDQKATSPTNKSRAFLLNNNPKNNTPNRPS